MTNIIFIFKDQPTYTIGFDFLISLRINDKPYNFNADKDKKRASSSPTFDDIYDDLKDKKEENEKQFKKCLDIIEQIYNCENIDIRELVKNLRFDRGLPIEVVLKIIKWFFIEQDIRYWNYSGRNKFYECIKTLGE